MITATDIAVIAIVLALLAVAGLVYYKAVKTKRAKLRDWEAASYTKEELDAALEKDREQHENK